MKLFVYGTLLSGEPANHKLTDLGGQLLHADRFEASMFTSNFDYPFIQLDGTGSQVMGEVYELGDESLAKCDAYEGFKPENPDRCLFLRSEGRTIYGEDVYFYHAGPRLVQYLKNNTIPAVPIISGNWKQFQSAELPIYMALKKMWQDDMINVLAAAGMLKKPRKKKAQLAS